MRFNPGFASRLLLIISFFTASSSFAQSDSSVASLVARTSPPWLKAGVIYQIFPRSFSPEGNLNGVTGRLDELHKLGVNILWLMPIHPTGQLKRKGTLGSSYSVRDYFAIDPALGSKDDLRRLVSKHTAGR